jgi:PKD repeat protein
VSPMFARALVLVGLVGLVSLVMVLGACPAGQAVSTGSEAGSAANTTSAASTATSSASATAPTTGSGSGTGAVNLPPTAKLTAEPTEGAGPLLVKLSGAGSSDADGQVVAYDWDFGDGEQASGMAVEHSYASLGNYAARLTVVDDDGASNQAQTLIKVAGCPLYDGAVSPGQLDSAALTEASGLAISRSAPGVLWTHNDSDPEGPRLYTFTLAGAPLGIYSLQGAKVQDWEDMALGPGPKPGQDYLYVGDIGDNLEQYSKITVYRVVEPPVDPRKSGVVASISGVEALTFTYPNAKAHNAETMLVDPQTGDLYVVTKANDGISSVYLAAAPLTAGPSELEKVGEIDLGLGGLSTGGSVSRAGDWVVIRTYFFARMWPRPAGVPLWQALVGGGCPVPVAVEPQGEAIAFAATGLDYFTTTEGATPALQRYVRK